MTTYVGVMTMHTTKSQSSKLDNGIALCTIVRLFVKNGLHYWSCKKTPVNGVIIEWQDGESLNWIDASSQPPFTYRLDRMTEMAVDVLSVFGIREEECRVLVKE